MAQNLVVQLLLKTGTFSTDLKTAKGQIQNFEKGCNTAGKSLSAFGNSIGIHVGSLAKFGGAIGAAAFAGKEFKAIMDSSQTTSDAFKGAIEGCKGVVDQFNTSIASADFTAFSNGLWGVFDAAKAVQDALDQLGNTQIAYDFMTKQNQTKFQEAYNVFKDPQTTAQMKEDAKAQMKEAVDAQFAYANNYSSALYKTYVAQVVKKAGSANITANNISMSQFEQAMKIDIGMNGDPEKAREENERLYKEYLSKLKEYGKNNLTAQADLKKRYADVIAIHAMLELMKDDELKGVAQLIGGMEDAKQVALSMQKTMNRAMSGGTTTKATKTTTKAIKEEIEAEEESLTYWQNILNTETKSRDALVKGTDEWKKHNEQVEIAEARIKEIKGVEEKMFNGEEGSLTYLKEMLTKLTKLRDEVEVGTDKWNEYNEAIFMVNTYLKHINFESTRIELNEAFKIQPPTIESLENILSMLKSIHKTIPIDSEDFKEMSDLIEQYNNVLDKVHGHTVEATKTDSWDTFNQAMANTSTIVNALTNTFRENAEVTAASVLQMVATALPAIGSLISAIGALTAVEATEAGVAAVGKAVTTSKHWIEAIAAVAALGSVVAAAISSASSNAGKVQKFASGGIVGGTSYTGDRVSANVNSGEMILNKSQQTRLFKMANGGTVAGGNEVTFHISGTDLVGVLNNQNRKNRLIG